MAGADGVVTGEGGALTSQEHFWVPFPPQEFAARAGERLDAAGVPWAVGGGWADDEAAMATSHQTWARTARPVTGST